MMTSVIKKERVKPQLNYLESKFECVNVTTVENFERLIEKAGAP
jgi:hypothetical protein